MHNDTLVIFTVHFTVPKWRNKIPVGRLGASPPQLFGRGGDGSHHPHEVGAYASIYDS